MRSPSVLPLFSLLAASALAACGNGSDLRRGVFETNRGTMELPYELVDGVALFQGDIVLAEGLSDDFATSSSGLSEAGAGRDAIGYRWWSNTIPYIVDAGFPNDGRISQAIAHFHANTSYRWVQRTNELGYVRFTSVPGVCRSPVGRQGSEQKISLGSATDCPVGSVIHEMGHAIGLWHEQSRADRDAHVTVVWSNILDDWEPQYAVYSDGADYGLYDFGSIMQYPTINNNSLNDPSKPGMTRTDGRQWPWQLVGLSDVDRQAIEELYSQSFGRAIAMGDFNGDGYQDAAVSAPKRAPAGSTATGGTVRVYLGSSTGLTYQKELSASAWTFVRGFERFGQSLAAGDFNGDGKDDLAVGAPGTMVSGTAHSGLVYTFFGSSSGLTPWQQVSQDGLGTAEAYDRFGYALAAADFNNDGRDDLAVGAPGEAPGGGTERSGLVFALKGSSSGLVAWTTVDQEGLGWNERGDDFGFALAAGDFDGDGRADLAVGAPHEKTTSKATGHVFTFRGSTTGFIASKNVNQADLQAGADDDFFGAALATGDFNGDGKVDLAVGAPGRSAGGQQASGQVYIWRGSLNGLLPHQTFTQTGLGTDERTDGFGAALATGDLNGDGRADLAVGAPGEAPAGLDIGSGLTFVYLGGLNAMAPWKTVDQAGLGTNESGDRFGAALAIADVNRDGKAELLVGAPGEAPGTNQQSGWAFFFRGSSTGPVAWTAFGP